MKLPSVRSVVGSNSSFVRSLPRSLVRSDVHANNIFRPLVPSCARSKVCPAVRFKARSFVPQFVHSRARSTVNFLCFCHALLRTGVLRTATRIPQTLPVDLMSDTIPVPQPGGEADPDSANVGADATTIESAAGDVERIHVPLGTHDTAIDGTTSDEVPAASAQDELDSGAERQYVHVRVEAFGSGVVLHEGIAVPSTGRVGYLPWLVCVSEVLPPRTRSFRLFVGHGGEEIDSDNNEPIANSVLATYHLDNKPLVLFPILCTSSFAVRRQSASIQWSPRRYAW